MPQNAPQPFKLREELDLSKLDPRFPAGHVWTFWAAPTAAVLNDVRAPLAIAEDFGDQPVSEETMAAALERFYNGVPELVLSTGSTGIDLSTPDKVKAVFNDESQDRELIAGIIDQYAYRIFTRRIDASKKAIGGLQPTADSTSSAATDSPFPA